MAQHVRLMVLLGLALAMPRAAGGVEVSLPLEGHYRPGKFLPIRIAHAAGAEVQISAPGCLTTVIGNPGEGEIMAPFLAVSDSVALQVLNAAPLGLKPLGEGQRLVVTADADGAVAREMFVGDELIIVPLDMNRPLLEPVSAWTGVDAVVLSPPARARLSDRQIPILLAGGVA